MKKVFGFVALMFLLSSCAPAPAVVAPEPEPAAVEEATRLADDVTEEDADWTDTPEEVVEEPEQEYTIAEKLAIIDGKGPSDSAGYQLMLDAAAPLCPDYDEEGLADLTVKARMLAADRGVDLEVLWGLGMVIMGVPEEAAGVVDCAEVMALALVAEVGS